MNTTEQPKVALFTNFNMGNLSNRNNSIYSEKHFVNSKRFNTSFFHNSFIR